MDFMMNLRKMRDYNIFAIILGIALITWFLQTNLVFNADVSWLLLATQRLLAGGSYSHNFFEINPPMILYIYTPAVGLVNGLGLHFTTALRCYVYALAAISLFYSFRLTRLIFLPRDDMLRALFLIAAALLFFILPANEFGQREHLLVILTLPYFLLVALRLQNPSGYAVFSAVMIGILAGMGFVIKPYFLLTLVLIEMYYCWCTRRVSFRPENLAILCVFIICAMLMLIFNRDYLTVVLPMVTHFYYQKYSLPVLTMLTSTSVFFGLSALVFYGLRYKNLPYQKLCVVLALSVVGFMIAFLIQQNDWYYHALPLITLAALLFIVLFILLCVQTSLSKKEYINLTVFFTWMLGYLVWHMSYMAQSILYFPIAFFGLFAGLFAVLFFCAHGEKNIAKIVAAWAACLSAGFFLFKYLLHSPMGQHLFLLTTTLLWLVFVLFIPNKSAQSKYQFGFFALLGMLVFSLPFYQAGYVYNYAGAYKSLYHNLLTMMAPYRQKSIYIFSNIEEFSFPQADYSHQSVASRFGCLGWVPALPYWGNEEKYLSAYTRDQMLIDFFINAMVEDIHTNKPDVIFVDVRNTDVNGGKSYFGSQQTNYVKLFLLNDAFKNMWRQYHYVKTVDGQPLFKFHVYERNASV